MLVQHHGDLGAPLAQVTLELGEGLQVAAGVLVAMSPGISARRGKNAAIDQTLHRVGLKTLAFPILVGADGGRGDLFLSVNASGAMNVIAIEGEGLFFQQGLQLAADLGIEAAILPPIKVGRRNQLRPFVRCAGRGTLLLQAHGHLLTHYLAQFEMMLVSPAHLAAFTSGIQLKPVRLQKSMAQAVRGGDGWMFECSGPGRVWIQGRPGYLHQHRSTRQEGLES